MRRCLVAVGLVFALLCSASAEAHFLFSRILPPAEGGRAVEVYFSELAAAGDPHYIEKVATGQFWLQTPNHEYRPLPMQKLTDRLRAHVPAQGTLSVAGELDYGVLRTFLLRHYSKTVAGKPAELNAMKPKGTALEIVGQFQSDRVQLSALLNGKPMPDAKFTYVDANLSGDEIKGDDQGRATFTPPGPGIYSIYIRHTDPTPGELRGTKYKEVREFATLAFAWPLEPTGSDAEAVQLFEDAVARRAAWKDFPGFTAKIVGEVELRPFEGTVKVDANGGVALTISDEYLAPWVQEQLESITMHRAASQSSSAGRPKPVVRFAIDDVDHPLGRLLEFDGGRMATSYRIKDHQITTVNRLMEGKNMSIRVLSNTINAEGQQLPHTFVVQYWDEPTGNLQRVEAVEDQFVRIGSWDLPVSRTVSTTSDGAFSIRNFTLKEHALAK